MLTTGIVVCLDEDLGGRGVGGYSEHRVPVDPVGPDGERPLSSQEVSASEPTVLFRKRPRPPPPPSPLSGGHDLSHSRGVVPLLRPGTSRTSTSVAEGRRLRIGRRSRNWVVETSGLSGTVRRRPTRDGGVNT